MDRWTCQLNVSLLGITHQISHSKHTKPLPLPFKNLVFSAWPDHVAPLHSLCSINLCSWDQVWQVWHYWHILDSSAADNRNRHFIMKTRRFCTSSRVPDVIPCRIKASSFEPSYIKIASICTAGKSFSTDAVDWIVAVLSITRNTFFTSLTKNPITNNLLVILCQDIDMVTILVTNRHISLIVAIIHVHKLAAGKFLWNSHHALVKLHRTIGRLQYLGNSLDRLLSLDMSSSLLQNNSTPQLNTLILSGFHGGHFLRTADCWGMPLARVVQGKNTNTCYFYKPSHTKTQLE